MSYKANFEPVWFGPKGAGIASSDAQHIGCKDPHYWASFENCVRCSECNACHRMGCILEAMLRLNASEQNKFLTSHIVPDDDPRLTRDAKVSVHERATIYKLNELIKTYLQLH